MSVAESVRATAEAAVKQAETQALEAAGMVFDSNYGMYYDYNSGYYYDAVSPTNPHARKLEKNTFILLAIKIVDYLSVSPKSTTSTLSQRKGRAPQPSVTWGGGVASQGWGPP